MEEEEVMVSMNENDCMKKESIKRKRKFCRNFVTMQGQF